MTIQAVAPKRLSVSHMTDDPTQRRILERIENWANNPHLVYGATMISPTFINDEDFTDSGAHDSENMPVDSGGTYKEITFQDMPIVVDRPFRMFVVSMAELVNHTPGTNTGVKFYTHVSCSWGVESYGPYGQQRFLADGLRYQISTMRSFAGRPDGAKEVTLKWAFQNTAGPGAINFDFKHLVTLYTIYYAPDASYESDPTTLVGVPPRWTQHAPTLAAYRR